jgi:UDP-N-acetylglucosamine 2-epimerase (non-hydrolysing)/GDP/UDP-N,N'-diacetylbacillosamine 2-epimerase (hydrolysing)
VDNGFRNAISKLAYWHFPACELHAKRLERMGENPEHIFVCGAPGVDNLIKPIFSREECEKDLGIKLKPPVALVCMHPETLGDAVIEMPVLKEYKTVIISGANDDIGGEKINSFWKDTAIKAIFRKTFDSKLWLSLMHHADVLIGNSSGFIFEGMTLGKKFINIGNRQTGRYEDTLALFAKNRYPFGEPGTVAKKIADKILSLEIPTKPIKYARV